MKKFDARVNNCYPLLVVALEFVYLTCSSPLVDLVSESGMVKAFTVHLNRPSIDHVKSVGKEYYFLTSGVSI